MHETVIARQIIEEAEKRGKVVSIKVEVGDLGHLPADEFYETISILAPWKVEIIKKRSKVECSCGFVGEPKILERGHDVCVFECPECGKIPKILEGDEIKLLEVEVE
jgi:Zn finger protein HypA/HybF involved in hydrogenase expression